ncbi:hypothetical protein CHLRE_02g114650v5 [Chlamydomonas reinhardtii]|uniref:Sulfotransferase n=1 Tax=Chlamydomonas reinhardtii TaxID=3055 RepID=A0A2K3E378_CHLRE|nr:uncharacterized protein CHLRE_02g114650v5 [Chlamydomonas reinhardtii]PNW87241.1 hypothetical protein CHLRE_02g114650v5 [Chlamydomonas reinhardtii]
MHALHAALMSRRGDGSDCAGVQQLLAALEAAGPELTTMDVLICSPGGVGSTQLSNHLNAHGVTTNLLTDTDNLRHCPRPPSFASSPAASGPAASAANPTIPVPGTAADIAPAPDRRDRGTTASISAGTTTGIISAASGTKPGQGGGPDQNPPHLPQPPQPPRVPQCRPRHVVYLYGDPLAAVASHYRRGHACHQAQKTSGHPARLSPANFPATFAEYVSRGEDLFGLEDHFRGWLAAPADYPVTLVRYEHMFDMDVALPLFTMLCGHKLSEQQVNAMAEAFVASKRPRSSQVPAEYYGRMYGRLLADMDALPALHTRDAAGVGGSATS